MRKNTLVSILLRKKDKNKGGVTYLGKRYKKGNTGKIRNNHNRKYRRRENELNNDIKRFRRLLFKRDVNNIDNYKEADRLRHKIKYNIRVQGRYVQNKSRQRRFVYYQQVSNFKGLYVTWKKESLPTFLRVRFHFPEHLIPSLCWWYVNIKTGVKCTYHIF